MAELPNYPEQLPLPVREGYGMQHVDPMVRTQLASGRARQRRRFTSVPTDIPVSWVFTEAEMQLFEAWFRWIITDGSSWFNAKLKTPVGLQDYRARFTGIYSASLHGLCHWRVTAGLELYERQTLSAEWAEFPDYIANSDIIDKAINREWPKAQAG